MERPSRSTMFREMMKLKKEEKKQEEKKQQQLPIHKRIVSKDQTR